MSADITTLMQQVHNYFLSLFQQRSGSMPGSTFLVFEPIGTPLSEGMFKLHPTDVAYSPAVAVEQFSSLVNSIPDVSKGTFQRTVRQVDDFYYGLIAGSLPVDATNELFTTLKAQALQRFEPTLGSLLKALVQFHPSYATPKEWYDPNVDENWTDYSFKKGKSSTTGVEEVSPLQVTPPSPRPEWCWRTPPVDGIPPLTDPDPTQLMESVTRAGITVDIVPEKPRFLGISPEVLRVMPSTAIRPETTLGELTVGRGDLSLPQLTEGQQSLTQNKSIVRSEDLTLARSIGEMQDLSMAERDDLGLAARERIATEEDSSTLSMSGKPVNTEVELKSSIVKMANLSSALDKYTSSQEVKSNNLSVSFKYCLVMIDRPWLSEAFLSLPHWYVRGFQAGAFSTGVAGESTGLFPVLPVGGLVVKDLQIAARWTEDDTLALQRATAFGPFSLIGRSISSGAVTLRNVGMQMIGWVCQVMPLLPPVKPPT